MSQSSLTEGLEDISEEEQLRRLLEVSRLEACSPPGAEGWAEGAGGPWLDEAGGTGESLLGAGAGGASSQLQDISEEEQVRMMLELSRVQAGGHARPTKPPSPPASWTLATTTPPAPTTSPAPTTTASPYQVEPLRWATL